ncbi:MAG: hypothetical protein KAW52_06870, partial [candidate division Zixibacteria bacterium]|nr:hypothetical protein [candidate division Zixibacteria bacterium]
FIFTFSPASGGSTSLTPLSLSKGGISNKNEEQKRDGEGVPEEEPKIIIRDLPISLRLCA